MREPTKVPLAILGAGVLLALGANEAGATTASDAFTSTITIQANSQVISTNSLNFGTQGFLAANTDVTSTFNVQCTNTTPYSVGLNAGAGTGATTTTRLMTNGANTVAYQMFSNAGRTSNWGNTVGTDTVAGTGNGTQQTLTVYGRAPPQTTPAPATYNDTVTVTITY